MGGDDTVPVNKISFPVASLKVVGHVGAVLRLLLIFLAAGSTLSASGTLRIAAESNLVFAVETLANAFREVNPEVKVEVVTGASDILVAQITRGAPSGDVLTKHGTTRPAALVFLIFPGSEDARKLFVRHGYGMPPATMNNSRLTP